MRETYSLTHLLVDCSGKSALRPLPLSGEEQALDSHARESPPLRICVAGALDDIALSSSSNASLPSLSACRPAGLGNHVLAVNRNTISRSSL